MILGLSFFCTVLVAQGIRATGFKHLSEFRTSLSKVLTLWHCVKVKQRYHYLMHYFSIFSQLCIPVMKTKFKGWSSLECFSMLRYSVTNCLSNLNDLVLPLPTPFKMIPMLMLSFILLLLFSQEFC